MLPCFSRSWSGLLEKEYDKKVHKISVKQVKKMIMGKKLKLTSIEHDEGKLIVSVEKCKELHEFLAYLLSDFGFQNKYLSYQQGEMKDIIKLSDLAESYKNRNLDITLFH